MERIPAFALLGCLLLLALAWFATRTPPQALQADREVAALRAELEALRADRLALDRRLQQLEEAMAVLGAAPTFPVDQADALPAAEEPLAGEAAADIEADETPATVPVAQQRIDDAGLTSEEFDSMRERAQELYLESFEQEWLQRREAFLAGGPTRDSRTRLRNELGDDAYDRYLYASGRPNRVRVQRVMQGSAAARAGLAEGDVLLSYDGERLFRFDDLRAASYQGQPGDTVLLEVRREDGTVAQMVIPRGPMGISGYGGWREAPGS